MSGKTILIVDPDETVSSIIQKSFLGYDPSSTIVKLLDFSNAFTIIDNSPIDCVICDSTCLLDSGNQKQVFEYINSEKLKNLIITTYGGSFSGLPQEIKDNYPIIAKPIDMHVFSKIVQEVVGPLQSEIIQQASLTNEQYNFCQSTIYRLKASIGARCIILSDTVGRVLASAGDTNDISTEIVTSLLGGGIASLLEAGKSLEDEGIIHLTFREGSKVDLYAINVGRDILLIIVIGKSQGYARLGTTWYYARQYAIQLGKYLQMTVKNGKDSILGPEGTKAISDELDRLFSG